VVESATRCGKRGFKSRKTCPLRVFHPKTRRNKRSGSRYCQITICTVAYVLGSRAVKGRTAVCSLDLTKKCHWILLVPSQQHTYPSPASPAGIPQTVSRSTSKARLEHERIIAITNSRSRLRKRDSNIKRFPFEEGQSALVIRSVGLMHLAMSRGAMNTIYFSENMICFSPNNVLHNLVYLINCIYGFFMS
jgi:hypothetical protein